MRRRIPARKRRGCRQPKFALGGETWRGSNGEDTLLPKIRGLDALKALNNDPATAGIAVVAFDRLVAEECRAPAAGGCLCLSGHRGIRIGRGLRGAAGALERIVRRLKLEVPATPAAK